MQLSQLSKSCQRLVREMQCIQYGRIENLPVKDGQPVFDDRAEIVHEIHLGKTSMDEWKQQDFELKQHVIHMLESFSRIRDGTVSLLLIREGLPVQVHIKKKFLKKQ